MLKTALFVFGSFFLGAVATAGSLIVLAESRHLRIEWTHDRRVIQVNGKTALEMWPAERAVAGVRK